MSKHIRYGFGSVRPYIHGPVALVDFIKQVFCAVELERHEFGSESYHVELQIGDSVVALEAGVLPEGVAAWTNSIYVYVENVDSVYDKAIQLDAEPIAAPVDKPYKERQAGFRDAAGNTWWVGSYQA